MQFEEMEGEALPPDQLRKAMADSFQVVLHFFFFFHCYSQWRLFIKMATD